MGKQQGFRAGSRVLEVDRTYWQPAEAVLMGVPPAQLFTGEPMRSRVARVWSGFPATSFPEPACSPLTLPHQPYPHSRCIRRIKRHSMCGQVKGVVRGWAWLAGGKGQEPPHTRSAEPQHRAHCSPDTAPASHREPLPTGAGTVAPGTPWCPLSWTLLGERSMVSMEGRLATPTWLLDLPAQCPLGSCPPSPEHCLPNHSSGGSIAGAGGSRGGGVWGSRESLCSGGVSRPGVEPQLCPDYVIWGSNLTSLSLPFLHLKNVFIIQPPSQENFEGSFGSGKKNGRHRVWNVDEELKLLFFFIYIFY